MPQTVAFISMSLDGFAAGPDIGTEHPLGRGGEALHEWLFAEKDSDDPDAQVVDAVFSRIGAVIIGNTMFTVGWDEWDQTNPFSVPVWVLTHNPREPIKSDVANPIHFVGDLETALSAARLHAGTRDVLIGGGPTTIDQVVNAGQLDEIIVTVVPILLGSGTRLFGSASIDLTRLDPVAETHSARVTHLHYRFPKHHAETRG